MKTDALFNDRALDDWGPEYSDFVNAYNKMIASKNFETELVFNMLAFTVGSMVASFDEDARPDVLNDFMVEACEAAHKIAEDSTGDSVH